MDEDRLRRLLSDYKDGRMTEDQVLGDLRKLPYEDLDFAKLDLHRRLRKGQAEVVFCQGKTPERVQAIFARLLEHHANVMGTRASAGDFRLVQAVAPVTAEFMGNRVTRVFDVGVAGIHRLLAHTDEVQRARVIIAVAGMEGALASVVAGLAPCPVVAVPTSIGYGASFGGLAALLAMLNSCAAGVGVVNIDNGFGAATLASMINRGRP
jgi:hypothetical protein